MKCDPNDNTGTLTKRELFAAMAMQGYNSNPNYEQSPHEKGILSLLDADALIAALNEGDSDD